MLLSKCLVQFFCQYLVRIKGVSENTVRGYRDSFTLFLPFAAQYLSIKTPSIKIDHLSPELIFDFLDYLEKKRNNSARTRNLRLHALKSLAKMLLLMHPEKKEIADKIINIPQKKSQKKLIGFFYPDEILKILESVDLKKDDGFRNYVILHLLYDSGARSSEIASLDIDYFDPQHNTIVVLGKGNRYRLINIQTKTSQLIELYVKKYRRVPKPLYRNRLFINQRGKELTRYGMYHICRKYIEKSLPKNRLKDINPVHSFRHSCAVGMLYSGFSIEEIRNRLGHKIIDSTMFYLHLDLSRAREMQEKLTKYYQSILSQDPKIEELIDWENRENILSWLDSL